METNTAKFLENGNSSGSHDIRKVALVPEIRELNDLPITEIEKGDKKFNLLHNKPSHGISNPIDTHDHSYTLRRSKRHKKSAIPDDYLVYLQELGETGIDDPSTFSQAIISSESNKWLDAMNEEIS